MIEDAKFRGVYIMADRLGLISQLGKAQEEQKAKKEAADAMEKRWKWMIRIKKTDQILKELRDTIETLNNAIKKVDECGNAIRVSYRRKWSASKVNMRRMMKEIRRAEAKEETVCRCFL